MSKPHFDYTLLIQQQLMNNLLYGGKPHPTTLMQVAQKALDEMEQEHLSAQQFYVENMQLLLSEIAGRDAPGLPGTVLDNQQDHQDCKDRKDWITMATKAVLTPVGMASFLNLKEPRAVVQGGEPRYSMNLIFDAEAQKSAEFKQLQVAINDAIKEKWPNKVPSNLRSPLRDGAEKEGQYEGYVSGTVFVNPWSKERPGVVDAQRNEILDLSTVYAGMKARAFVRPFAYESGMNKGVGLLLDAVQFVADGARIDGKTAAAKAFPEYEEQV